MRGQQGGRLQRLGSGLESMQSIEMALPGGEVRQAYDHFRGQAEEGEQQEHQEFDLHGGRSK